MTTNPVHIQSVDQPARDGVGFLPAPPTDASMPTHSPVVPVGVKETIDFWGATLDDAEKNRKATENRLRSLTDTEWGQGLAADSPQLITITAELDAAVANEKRAAFQLRAAFKDHPLYEPVIATKGLGWKSVARWLAAVGGDPYWHSRDDRPRTLGELNAYCGFHVENGIAPRRRKGVQSAWSSPARMRAWLIAEAIVKAGGPYRTVYDEARAKADSAVHTVQCQNTLKPVGGRPAGSNGCGTQAHPEWGAPGSPLRDGHKAARARRAVAKAVLRDLWSYMRLLHGGHE